MVGGTMKFDGVIIVSESDACCSSVKAFNCQLKTPWSSLFFCQSSAISALSLEFSAKMEMFSVLSNILASSHSTLGYWGLEKWIVWLRSCVFYFISFHFILTSIKLNNYMCLEAIILDSRLLGTDSSLNLGPKVRTVQSRAPDTQQWKCAERKK